MMMTRMTEENLIHTSLPWHLSGEGYILNYWISPSFIRAHRNFGLAPSKWGRMVQVILVRYHTSPVGPYDELLLLDHTTTSFNLRSNIPKIYVSTQTSVDEGRFHWGIPKELATFKWSQSVQHLHCEITVGDETLSVDLDLLTFKLSPTISSALIPSRLLNIHQQDHQFSYQFSPEFVSKIAYISKANWQNSQSIFPDFSTAVFMKGFYSTDFQLVFPAAVKTSL